MGMFGFFKRDKVVKSEAEDICFDDVEGWLEKKSES